jgi:4-amino-4-deoxy-L-arabinose transferase-like glycosyltransferase
MTGQFGRLASTPPPERARVFRRGSSILAGAALFAFCLLVQYASGCWQSGFVAYPDEPAHFVGAAMVRDWLASGRWFSPYGFASDYYTHYPYFAIGYWPPLFSIVTGLWMIMAGVGRIQALLVPAACAAGTAGLIFHMVRRRAGEAAGLCAAVLYLNLPASREWMCAVMVDHMTAMLSLAAAVCVLRSIERPGMWNTILGAAVCASAILSKYSAAFVLLLPLAVPLVLRSRRNLLTRPAFLMQPVLVLAIVGPWVLWTSRLATYGLPSHREALTAWRVASFAAMALRMFPPVWLVAIAIGIAALLLRPAAWRADLAMIGIFAAGQMALLIVSPVGPEPRYFLGIAAALLIASFAGWVEISKLALPAARSKIALPALGSALALAYLGSYSQPLLRIPRNQIAEAVVAITADPAAKGRRILVPSNLEGPFVAEFVARSSYRPDHFLTRPNRLLARSDWFGDHYSPLLTTPEQMQDFFERNPVDLVILDAEPRPEIRIHERLLEMTLLSYPDSWRRLAPPGKEPPGRWTIYEHRGHSR